MNREEFQEGLIKGLKESRALFADVDIQYQAPQKGGGGGYPHIFYITITDYSFSETFRCEAFFRNGSFSAFVFDGFDNSVGSSTSRDSVDELVDIISKSYAYRYMVERAAEELRQAIDADVLESLLDESPEENS